MTTKYSTEAAAQKCTLAPVRATREWEVGTERPLVVLPQLQTRYQVTLNDVRLRPVATPEYVDLLYKVIEFTRLRHAQFCIFPEYSWPVAEAERVFALLDRQREEGRAYFLSFEHMTVAEYKALLAMADKAKMIDAAIVREEIEELARLNAAQDEKHGIVNVCFVALQTPNRLMLVPQRKLRPAALEEFRDQWAFVPGTTVRLFESGDGCRFAVLICFDLIHRSEETPERPRDLVARERMNYLFVPECNPEPLHDFYFKGAIAMFQSPRWAQHHPIIITANVAADSDIPALRQARPSFGFSRMIGRLGAVDGTTRGNYHALYQGFVTADSPRALFDINSRVREVYDPRVSTLVIRPEQSIALLRLPTMTTGPTRDVSVHRFDTTVKIYRPVGADPGAWRVVMPIPTLPQHEPEMEIPEDLVVRDGLVGVDHLVQRLRDLIEERAAPIRVVGDGGTGKSALVATVLSARQKEEDVRVIWIDIPAVQQGLEPLVEAILRKLGHGDAVALPMEKKWRELRRELQKRPTIVVLDGAESAGDRDLAAELKRLHTWRTLVIVITQLEPGGELTDDDVEVRKLERDVFRELVLRTSHRREEDLPSLFIETTYRATGGTALGAVWAGQLLRAAPPKIAALVKELGKTDNEDGLQTIYNWCHSLLKPLEREILGILCELPAPVPVDDLHLVLSTNAMPGGIQNAINGLHALGLLIHTRKDRPAGQERLHFRHPFVQRFWRRGHDNPQNDPQDETWQRTVRWAQAVTQKYGKEGGKAYYPQLAARWSNIAHVMRMLGTSSDLGSKEAFLAIWQNVDTFLWITARWRERLEFGDKAVEFASDPLFERNYLRLQAQALYDSLGKTHWHRDQSTAEAERLLRFGKGVAEATGDDAMRARYHWYRSRLLLFREDPEGALEEANIAAELAGYVDEPELTAIIENALGNARRELGEYDRALSHYENALKHIAAIRSDNAEELRDIIIRNRGRVELDRGDYTAAIEHLEEAMEKFGRAQNIAQQAECAVYHARALAGIDELAEAERELAWAEAVASTIGSAVVRRQIEKARAEIEDFRQQRP